MLGSFSAGGAEAPPVRLGRLGGACLAVLTLGLLSLGCDESGRGGGGGASSGATSAVAGAPAEGAGRGRSGQAAPRARHGTPAGAARQARAVAGGEPTVRRALSEDDLALLQAWAGDAGLSGEVRYAALRRVEALDVEQAATLAFSLCQDRDPLVRVNAAALLERLGDPRLADVLATLEPRERRALRRGGGPQ